MHRSTARLLVFGVVSTIASLAPDATGAQSSPTGLLAADQIRSECVSQGFQVDKPITWWTNDGVTTFHVTDSSTERVLMVLVYPDLATAGDDRATVQARGRPVARTWYLGTASASGVRTSRLWNPQLEI